MVVDHGNKWTVFLPMQGGVDVFRTTKGLKVCELHLGNSCRHVKAVEQAKQEVN